jgi:hypothetical protein
MPEHSGGAANSELLMHPQDDNLPAMMGSNIAVIHPDSAH